MKTSLQNTKHSPAPWTVQRYSNFAGFSIYASDGFGCVAERWEKIDSDERNEIRQANARLIAAAPELLAACGLVLKDEQAGVGAIIISSDTLAAIKSAIAKATGGV